jgi:hypothetical protein
VLGAITLLIWAWVIVGWILQIVRGRRTPLGAETAD